MAAESAERRFWEQIEKRAEGCWIWTGHTKREYGYLKVGGRDTRAHRFAYELLVGPIPSGLLVLHRCDVPACVNPGHLFLGTQADNVRDAVAKGRMVGSLGQPARGAWALQGEEHATAKLTADAVLRLLARRDEGATQVNLAREFGVSQATVSKILLGQSWSHISHEWRLLHE